MNTDPEHDADFYEFDLKTVTAVSYTHLDVYKRQLFPWGDGMDYSMHLHHFECPEDEDKPFDMEEPNFFGASIAYAPYMREVVKAEQFTTCGGDGGRSICGGL